MQSAIADLSAASINKQCLFLKEKLSIAVNHFNHSGFIMQLTKIYFDVNERVEVIVLLRRNN